jgi:murein DD-endopeptidase MepM/ murein hydrolase activator NlpD
VKRAFDAISGCAAKLAFCGALFVPLAGCRTDEGILKEEPSEQFEAHPNVVLPREGVYHVVQHGDTLASVCAAYKKSVEAVAKVNGLSPGQSVHPGQRLFIPGAKNAIEQPPIYRKTVSPELVPYRGPRTGRMICPAEGQVVVRYRQMVLSTPSDGIEIATQMGAPVWAAQDGVVSFVNDDFLGLGTVVLVQHDSATYSLYGHLHEPRVKIGDRVRQGDIIARAGNTGRTSGPQLHFRVYQQGSPVDPSRLFGK